MNLILKYLRAKPFQLFFVVSWAFFVYQIIMAGFEPNPFAFEPDSKTVTHVYPISIVIKLIMAMSFHAVLMFFIDLMSDSRWKFLLMFAITLLLLSFFILFIMHASPPLSNLVFWLLISTAYLLLTCIWQACRYFIKMVKPSH